MRFAAPEWLHLLWILPLVGIWWIWRLRRAERDLARWCGHGLWSRMVPDRRLWAPWAKGALVLLATAFLAVAAARPQMGSRVVEMKRSGIDLVVALDVSESMLAEDLLPNRITRAKQEIGSLIERLRGDRIGLVAFAGDAFVQCPLTLDYGAARMFLRYMDTGLVPIPGTSIARAIDVAVQAHEAGGDGFQAVVLITDGEDHEGEITAAAQQASEAGVKVFAVGIGADKGEPIPIRDAQGNVRDYKRDRNGEVVLSKSDGAALERLCRATGGRYFDGSSGGLALERLYAEIEAMEDREHEGGWATEFEDRYGYFVAVAFLLLLAEGWIAGRRRPGRNRRRVLQTAAAIALLLARFPAAGVCALLAPWGLLLLAPGALLLLAPGAALADEGISAYSGGRYEAARDYYEQYARENPDDPRVDFNLGTTLHQTREFDPSESALQRAIRSDDPTFRARAFYNLGSTQVKKGDLEAARESFRMSLLSDPSDRDAKTNFEIVDRLLRESPPDSTQQESDSEDDQDDQDDRDQQDQDQQDQDQQDQDPQDDQDGQNQQDQDPEGQNEEDQDPQGDEPQQDGQDEEESDQPDEPREEESGEEGESEGGEEESQEPEGGESAEEELPISEEEARRLLEALGQQEMQLQAERMKAQAKTRKVEKDW